MTRFICLFGLSLLLWGCDATEEAVISQRPMSESTGNVLGDLNQRQTDTVDGMYETGGLNEYEKEQMDESIGSTSTH